MLVLCAKEIQGAARYSGITVLKCPLDDNPRVGITSEEWNRAVATAVHVASLIHRGARVLVTCQMGLNRSGLVSALTAHNLTGQPGHVCVGIVRAHRPGALFNRSFVNALVTRLK